MREKHFRVALFYFSVATGPPECPENLKKYLTMLKIGLAEPAIEGRMKMDGIDPVTNLPIVVAVHKGVPLPQPGL